jgi:hypothetical protein
MRAMRRLLTDQGHIVVSLVRLFRSAFQHTFARVVRTDERDSLHRLAETCSVQDVVSARAVREGSWGGASPLPISSARMPPRFSLGVSRVVSSVPVLSQ